MKKSIHTSVIKGEVKAPASKSYTIRALAGAFLSQGNTIILNPSICEDTKAAIEIIEQLGAEVEISKSSFFVRGGFNPEGKILNCGESALCVRLFSAIAPLLNRKITISGSGSLLKRNFRDVANNLNSIGINCSSDNGFLPLVIDGEYKKNEITVDCSTSSQFLSGLLYAVPLLETDSLIKVDNLKSKPYIDLTIDILLKFGIKINHNKYKEFKIQGNQIYKPTNITVEGDWSNSAFILVAGAIAGDVKIFGLNLNSYQGDRKILEVLEKSGASNSFGKDFIQVKKSDLSSFEYDSTDTPDLLPPLTSLAVACNGISKIIGTERLLNKESNRLNALISEFTKLGIKIFEKDDTLYIEGGKIIGCDVDSHNDHRIAMALSVAGLISDSSIKINNSGCVSKSYPEFFDDLKNIGGNINE